MKKTFDTPKYQIKYHTVDVTIDQITSIMSKNHKAEHERTTQEKSDSYYFRNFFRNLKGGRERKNIFDAPNTKNMLFACMPLTDYDIL